MSFLATNKRALAFILGGFVAGVIVSSVLIWSVMYPAAMRWNDNSMETECTVVAQEVLNHTCTTGGAVAPVIYACYGATVNLSYPVLDVETKVSTTYVSSFALTSSKHSWQSEYDWLQSKYPLDKVLQCWYNVFEPTEVHLSLVTKSAYVGSTIAVVIAWILGCACVGYCLLD